MRWLFVLLALLCSGCSLTLNASSRWKEDAVADTQLRQQYEQVTTAVKAMSADLAKTPADDPAAIRAVLARYGITLKGD